MNMHALPSAMIAASVLLTGLLSATAAQAQNSVCKKNAQQLFVACQFDIRDDLNETRANCDNIGAAAARRDCLAEARDTQREEARLCAAQRRARRDACELLGENRYDPDPLLDPLLTFIDPNDIPEVYPVNPYVSLAAGHTYVLRAGEDGEETVVVHVTDETREIQGVECRIVVDAAIVAETDPDDGDLEYVPVEITDDWFAQDSAGDVYYCGEIARNFEDGVLVDLDGSFEAGRDFAKAGVLIRAQPVAGEVHRQEFALAEAEDIVHYVDTAAVPSAAEGGENSAFPCAPSGCLKTFDFAPLEPEASEFKYYLAGVGFVLAVALEDGEITGEREELVCVGDSLDILEDPSCEIADPDELFGELCELSPEAFCD